MTHDEALAANGSDQGSEEDKATTNTLTTAEHNPARRQCERLRRRREASRRLPPLPDGRRDPLDPPLHEPLTVAGIEAWRAAYRHLHQLGYRVDVPARVLALGRAQRCHCCREHAR